MKLQASCSPFESIPASVWLNIKTAILTVAHSWGVPISIDDDLTVRDAEVRFEEWKRRPKDGE